MKRILFLQALMLLCVGHAFAYDFEVDGIYYNKINSDEVSVIHNGHPNSYSGAVSIPSTVSYEEVTYKVTSIGSNAFYGSSNMTSVTIANGVTSIGEFAFFNCSKLSSITIPNSVESIESHAFRGCFGLTSITITDGVTSIGDGVFYACSGLTSVTIPSSVTSLGNYVFCDCDGLASITVDSGNTHYDSRNDCNAIIETASNTLIEGCNNTTIPNSVTSIGNDAFSERDGLTSITIPNSVTSIGNDAFHGCLGLTSITIPSSVESIGNDAFHNCLCLTSVTIGSGLSSIDSSVFENCTGLKKLIYADGCETAIRTRLKNITSVIIPNSVIRIDENAFKDFSELTSVIIGSGVKFIDYGAFSGCTSLKAIICKPNWPPALFGSIDGNKMIYVPAGSISAYKSEWKGYTFWEMPDAILTIRPTADTYAADMASVDKMNASSVLFSDGIDPSLSISKIKEGMNPNCLYYIYTGDELSGDNVVNVETGEASSIKLTDNCVYNAIRPISADRVEYVHNPSVWANGKSGWETIVLPFEPTDYIASSAGYLAPITLGSQGNFWLRRFVSASSESVFFTSTLDGRMEANVPYLIAFPGETMGQGHLQGQSITFRASNVDLPMTDMPTLKKGAFTFTGNYDTTADDCTGYALDANGASFVETATVGKDPFRAYFQKEGGVAAARQLSIKVATDDMDTEGLIGVVKGEGNASAPCYDLQGRTQTQPRCGLYITNGKKVLVR